MQKITFTLAALGLLFLGRTASATIAVFPVEGVNLSEGEVAALEMLLAEEIAKAGSEMVLPPSDTKTQITQPANFSAAASQMGANRYVQGAAVRLGSKIRITLTLFEQSGKQLHEVTYSATSLEDLDPVLNRMATALMTGQDIASTATRHNITGREARAKNTLFTEKLGGVKTGYIFPVASDATLEPIVTLQFDLRLDADAYFVEFGAGLALPTDQGKDYSYGSLFAEIGASYYLLDSSVSPYIGAGLSPRLQFSSGDGGGGVGVVPYAQLGVMLMRESSTRIYAELRVGQNVIAIHDKTTSNGVIFTTPTTIPQGGRYPTEFGFNVGIGW